MEQQFRLTETIRRGVLDGARRLDVDSRAADDLAKSVVELVRMEHGGFQEYIESPAPDGKRSPELRDAARADAASGMSVRDLAKKYDRVPRTIRNWLK